MASTHHIVCLCGTIREDVQSRSQGVSDQVSLSLCHCDTCRHSSGLLCTSYYPIAEPALSKELRTYVSAGGSTRYFCAMCGCHMLRSRKTVSGSLQWEVATGAITSSTGGQDAKYTKHNHVEGTKDGGASVWIPTFDDQPMETTKSRPAGPPTLPPLPQSPDSESLGATCACGNVRFHITRPGPESHEPHSSYPDLMYAYKTTPTSFGSNPNRDKWWIQGHKYLAGTCACASCRLFTGFEIQTWTFVPRANIFFHVLGSNGGDKIMPLDFGTLPKGVLTSYSSSPGVVRDFCSGCGATVFWHDGIRPDLVDVSVGLLRAEEGARAERWLKWWTDRVSFEEETETGREGAAARTARKLIGALEGGLMVWAKKV